MAVLGVSKGKLYMVEYDPEWAVLGQEMVDTLKGIMKKAVDIRHAGSTSVPGMLAKPLIDIIVGVRDLEDVLEYVDELEALDIHYAGEVIPGQREFSRDDPVTGSRAYHIHVVPYDGEKWHDYLDIVDYLKADEKARDAYVYLKRALLLRYEDRPQLYGPAKHVFVDDLRDDAREWRKKQNG